MLIKNQHIRLSGIGLLLLGNLLYAAPSATNKIKLHQMADEFSKIETQQKNEAIEFANRHNMPIRQELSDGSPIEIQKIENGIPRYYTTHNADAAITTRTQHLWSAPYGVTGNGFKTG